MPSLNGRVFTDQPAPLPPGWTEEREIRVNDRIVTPGSELSVTGLRGRWLFSRKVTTDTDATWVWLRDGDGKYRAVSPDRIKTVHRIAKTRQGVLAKGGS